MDCATSLAGSASNHDIAKIMLTLHMVLLILALLSFLGAALDIKVRVQLMPLGLFLWLLARVLGGVS